MQNAGNGCWNMGESLNVNVHIWKLGRGEGTKHTSRMLGDRVDLLNHAWSPLGSLTAVCRQRTKMWWDCLKRCMCVPLYGVVNPCDVHRRCKGYWGDYVGRHTSHKTEGPKTGYSDRGYSDLPDSAAERLMTRKMVHPVKVLPTHKPDGLSWIPGTHTKV